MLDIKLIREQAEIVRKALSDRQLEVNLVDSILELDRSRRDLLSEVEVLKAERNVVSREIGQSKDPTSRQRKIDEMKLVGDKISDIDNHQSRSFELNSARSKSKGSFDSFSGK